MEIAISIPTNVPAAILALLLALFYLLSRKPTKNKPSPPPEAGGAWPLIGHLHLLGGPLPPHVVLGNMANKYGPIFTVKMGVHQTLVISNSEMAKECLTTNDKVFATRPKTLATVIMGYNRAMLGFTPYGPYWRENRKIVTLEVLSNHRIEMLEHVRELEVRTFVKEMYKLWGKTKNSSDKALVEMKRWFGDITVNLVVKMIVGKSAGYMTTGDGEESEVWKQALRDFFNLSGRFVAADGVPFLRWFDIGGYEKEMVKTAKELDAIAENWLKEHKEKRASGIKQEEEDFMDAVLNILGDAEGFHGLDPDTFNKALCLSLILAASDTTAVTITWALSSLVNNPEALKKVQNELDVHIGRERQVQESDIKNLEYLQAVVKETMRLYPAGPLAVPHESIEDCVISGYNVPAGTRLLLNLWKIHHDPAVWENPFEFRPERFLTTSKDFDARGKNFEFIPFGSGRRMCPGISFAFQVLQLTLASLIHSFDIETPTGKPTDMTESIGLTNLKATPLEILITPRLPHHLYS